MISINNEYLQKIKDIFLEVLDTSQQKEIICQILEGKSALDIGKNLKFSEREVQQITSNVLSIIRLNLSQIDEIMNLRSELQVYKREQERRYNIVINQYVKSQRKYAKLIKEHNTLLKCFKNTDIENIKYKELYEKLLKDYKLLERKHNKVKQKHIRNYNALEYISPEIIAGVQI